MNLLNYICYTTNGPFLVLWSFNIHELYFVQYWFIFEFFSQLVGTGVKILKYLIVLNCWRTMYMVHNSV